jgi:hypothetical protein
VCLEKVDMAQLTRMVGLTITIALAAGLISGTVDADFWLAYTHQSGGFIPAAHRRTDLPADRASCSVAGLPASWHVLTALQADLTDDGHAECVLLVWRPWEDWPIMRWSGSPSPIANNRDAHGDSAHIILIDPTNRRELWAGSALAVPIVQIAVGDVDGDGDAELIALEGDYATGRYGTARHVAVWRWNGFGFTLAWRSPLGRFIALGLSDVDGNGASEILVR